LGEALISARVGKHAFVQSPNAAGHELVAELFGETITTGPPESDSQVGVTRQLD
jgi:hypothetical protein